MRLADRYEVFLLDLDGVVYRGDEILPEAAETVAALREESRRVLFLTNHSAWIPEQVARRLSGMGVQAEPDDVVSAAHATGDLVARDAAATGRSATAFLIGEEGLRSALSDAGVEIDDDGAPGYVVVGWDRAVDYEKLRRASVLVRAGSRLVAANADATFPAPGGELWPGAGALLAAVETASGRRAEVVGKPHRRLFDVATERAGTRAALVVGDRIETDVAGAASAGLDGALVLTGAATLPDLLDHDAQPVLVLRDLSRLLGDGPLPRIRPARPGDEHAVRELVASAGLADEDWEPAATTVAEDGRLYATAAAEVRGSEAYLRSVAVREDARRSMLGALVVAAAVRRAVAVGAERVWLLTEDAAGFFERLGFERADEALPAWVRERSSACSESAVPMTRRLAV